jgi:hypothetical protein
MSVTGSGTFLEYEYDHLHCFFQGGDPPAGFEVALVSSEPVNTDTELNLVGEPSGNGYARASLARDTTDWPTVELNDGHYRAVSKGLVFTAEGGDWPQVNFWVLLTTGSSQRVWAWGPTSEPLILKNNQSYTQIIAIRKSG